MTWLSRKRRLDFVIAIVALSIYSLALSQTAISGFWSAPDFDHLPRTGLACLMEGWLWYPVQWMSNPLFLIGTGLMLFGKRLPAAIVGIMSAVLVVAWTFSFCREFSWQLLRTGYYFWVVSVFGFSILAGLYVLIVGNRR